MYVIIYSKHSISKKYYIVIISNILLKPKTPFSLFACFWFEETFYIMIITNPSISSSVGAFLVP
jgi:hypothetical protein